MKKTRQNLVKLAHESLSPLGFSRVGNNLIRERDHCYQIINFQGSSYGGNTYVNQMVWYKDQGSLPSSVNSGTFHFSDRMESRVPSEEPYWRSVLQASGTDTDRDTWKGQLATLLVAGLPEYDLLLNPSDARSNYIAKRVSGLLVPSIAQAGA